MASAQDLRKRIKSVTNTQQITKAMKMVASARLRRAQQKAQGTAPYADGLREILVHAVPGVSIGEVAKPGEGNLLAVREVKRTAYVVIGADKGLAGAYTSSVLKRFFELVKEKDRDTYDVIAVGRKIGEHCRQHKVPLAASLQGFSEKPAYENAVAVVREATALFSSGKVDEVIMIYTHFVNSLTQNVTETRLLPVTLPEAESTGETAAYMFAPEQGDIIRALLPKYLESTVYNGLLQSAASELGSRMTAMTAATDNASELISTLDLEYNKLRQASITNEISEIVGGANALQ